MPTSEATEVGGRTLEMFSGTPRLNDWMYSKISDRVRGDVLEIGSGIGNISRHLRRDARSLVLTDLEPHYLDSLRKEFRGDEAVLVERFDLDAPVPAAIAERRFDAIVAFNVIEHIEDDAKAVRTLAGLLREGGWLLAYVPACGWAYGTVDEALGHFRRYSRAGFAGLIARAGLRVESARYMNMLGLAGWLVNGRILRRRVLDARQVALFEKIVDVVRMEDRVQLPIGLGVVVKAQKVG
jgi:SAM-dependent methyltransferase